MTRKVMILLLALLTYAVSAAQSIDAEPAELKAREINRTLRCVVCQNESLAESNAPLAADMRELVLTRVKAGDSEAEIIAYMRDLYGDYVLLKPPVQRNTFLLWSLPFILLIASIFWAVLRRQSVPISRSPAPLSNSETQRLETLFKELDP